MCAKPVVTTSTEVDEIRVGSVQISKNKQNEETKVCGINIHNPPEKMFPLRRKEKHVDITFIVCHAFDQLQAAIALMIL